MPEKMSPSNSATRVFLGCFVALVLLSGLGLFWFRLSNSWGYIPVLVGLLPVGVSVVYLHCSGKLKNPDYAVRAFAFILLAFCLTFVFAIPPMSSPDEGHHFLSSYWLSDIVMGDASINDGSNFPVRSDVVDMYEGSSMAIGASQYDRVTDSFRLLADSPSKEQVTLFGFNFGSENIVAKIPSVLGIVIARIMNLGAYPLFYIGRLCSAFFFVACAVIAVSITPVGKAVFMGVSLLPMTLQLAGSYSYDCGIISFSLLLSAVLLHAILSEERMGAAEMASLVILAAIVTPFKVVYAPILLLLFLIPRRRFGSKKAAFLFRFAVVFAAICSLVLIRFASLASLVGTGADDLLDHRGAEVGTFYSLEDLLSDPMRTAAIFVRTLFDMGDFYVESMIGSLPGWLQENLRAPNLLIYAYLVCLLFSVQKTPADNMEIPKRLKLCIVVALFLTYLGVSLSMFIGWTFVTEVVIQGVQGRYFLPVLPLGLLVFRSEDIEIKKSPIDICLTAISLLNVIYIMRFASIALSLP